MVFDIDSGVQQQRRTTHDDSAADVRCVAPHEGCSVFVVAPDWDFIATASAGRQRGQGDVRLWDLDSGDAVVDFQVRQRTQRKRKALAYFFDSTDADDASKLRISAVWCTIYA